MPPAGCSAPRPTIPPSSSAPSKGSGGCSPTSPPQPRSSQPVPSSRSGTSEADPGAVGMTRMLPNGPPPPSTQPPGPRPGGSGPGRRQRRGAVQLPRRAFDRILGHHLYQDLHMAAGGLGRAVGGRPRRRHHHGSVPDHRLPDPRGSLWSQPPFLLPRSAASAGRGPRTARGGTGGPIGDDPTGPDARWVPVTLPGAQCVATSASWLVVVASCQHAVRQGIPSVPTMSLTWMSWAGKEPPAACRTPRSPRHCPSPARPSSTTSPTSSPSSASATGDNSGRGSARHLPWTQRPRGPTHRARRHRVDPASSDRRVTR